MPGPVRWMFRAPAERASLLTVPVTWTAAEIMHAQGVPGLDLGLGTLTVSALAYGIASWRYMRAVRQDRDPLPDDRLPWHLAASGLLMGGWTTAATMAGPMAGPHHALTWTGLAGAMVGYRWLRRHDAVVAARERRREAAEREQRRAEWQETAHRWGISGSYLDDWEETRLGERMVVDVRGTSQKLVSRINKHALAETIEQDRVLPRSRVEISDHHRAGKIVVNIRTGDPWGEPIPHPVLARDHEITLPFPATARLPLPVGQDPVTGHVLPFTVWDEDGGKNILVAARKGSGKSTLLSCLRERLTAAEDAMAIDINLSKAREEHNWAPACHLNAIGRHQAGRAISILTTVLQIIELRAAKPRTTPNHQPTCDEPLIVIIIDEVQDAVSFTEIRDLVRRIARSGRSEAVSLVISGQRGVAAWLGGSDVRSQLDAIWCGKFNRQSEVNNAVGEFANLVPDMTRYGEGQRAVWAMVDVDSLDVHKGRAWRLDQPGDLEWLALERAASQPDLEPDIAAQLGDRYLNLLATDAYSKLARDHGKSQTEMPPVTPWPDTAGQAPASVAVLDHVDLDQLEREVNSAIPPDLRARLDAMGQRTADARRALDETPPLPEITPEQRDEIARAEWSRTVIPDAHRERLMGLVAGEGTTIGAAADELGVEKHTARKYLERLRIEDVIQVEGEKRGARWKLIQRPAAAAEDGDGQ